MPVTIDFLLFCLLLCFPHQQASNSSAFNSDPKNCSGRDFGVREVLVIGDKSDNWILNAHGISGLPDGSLLVSDKLDYKVKRFDRKGRKIAEVGKRGKGAGEFRGPGPIDVYNNIIAVADFASPRIQIFSSDLTHKSAFYAPGAVFDLNFDPEGYLWLGALTGQEGQSLLKCDIAGKVIQTISLQISSGDDIEDIFSLDISQSGDIIVAYGCLNRIEIWDIRGKFKNRFEVAGIPLRPPKKTISKGLFSKGVTVPEGNIFQSAAVDPKGNIFVLASDYTDQPNRDVYVFDSQGKYVSQFTLPTAASHLWISAQGDLYTIDTERTLVRKYHID